MTQILRLLDQEKKKKRKTEWCWFGLQEAYLIVLMAAM